MGFTGLGLHPVQKREQTDRHALASCNRCAGPLTAVLSTLRGEGWHSLHQTGDLLTNSHVRVEAVFPVAAPVDIPAHLPEAVAQTFREAAESRKRKAHNAACAMYRRAMEQGLKAFSPDVEAWKLERRIDTLAAQHRITPELQAWAHELRLDLSLIHI